MSWPNVTRVEMALHLTIQLHSARHFNDWEARATTVLCAEDRQAWPCKTIAEINDALGRYTDSTEPLPAWSGAESE